MRRSPAAKAAAQRKSSKQRERPRRKTRWLNRLAPRRGQLHSSSERRLTASTGATSALSLPAVAANSFVFGGNPRYVHPAMLTHRTVSGLDEYWSRWKRRQAALSNPHN
jgi:hypothetical protein